MSRPYFRHQSGRMFDNAFLEACSRVHPRTPFLFYIPLTWALFTWALYSGTTTLVRAAIFLPLGFLTWVGLEYCIHRYFFHWEGNGPFTRWLHEITHGYHHKYPDDVDRLVMPLGASIPMASLIAGSLWLVGSLQWTVPYFLGVVWGYLWYDFLHWSTHHRTPRTAWGKALRAHHMAHHFATPDRNFGISHRWVDLLVGSGGRRQSRRSEQELGVQGPQA
ncbi:MAG TPA: sterol desaturase family protein [Myxococcaceae bacterium]|nr:sterol desaturase family protein [Myxococcaceae bacterium]